MKDMLKNVKDSKKKKQQEKYMTKYLKDRYRMVKCNVN